MAAVAQRSAAPRLHPLHAVVLAGTIPPFLGALLADLAYAKTHEIQWINFAAWLNAGGMVLAGLVLACALAGVIRRRASPVYFVLVLATFLVGFWCALVHARDAWATMPTASVLSAIVLVLTVFATAVGFSTLRAGSGS